MIPHRSVTSSVVVEESSAETAVTTYRDPLSGLPGPEPFESLPGVYAVMIDNSVDAWPVSGVDKAFLVIEAPVEAAIPRLEAFFSSDASVDKIGPVRSARPYFVDWADEFDALYAHVGGSNAALDLIGSRGTFDLNEFFHGNSFWRSSDRSAPHNAYTSSELLAKAVESARERDRAPDILYGTWTFKDPDPNRVGGAADGAHVNVRFNSDLYAVEWTYNAATNRFSRTQGGKAYETSSDHSQIFADNVAVLVTDIDLLDAVGRRSVRTVGKGTAWVLQDGVATKATWEKPSSSERLRFYAEDGAEIAMNPGTTWIEVVPDESNVTF